jgi:hypothetical protein
MAKQPKKMQHPAHTPPGTHDTRPVDARTGTPLEPRAQPGYYPGFSTLRQQAFWDDATRQVVLARIHQIPPLRFFSEQEAALLQCIADCVLPQDDRDEAHRIPIVPQIDARLAEERGDGYRFEDMPDDGEAYHLGLQAIDEIAQYLYQQPFTQITPPQREAVMKSLHDSTPPAAHEIWQRMGVQHFWLLLLQDVVGAYYAHPYAWDEIGFGGPAYPRGYMRLNHGLPEPWERDEKYYPWHAPSWSISEEMTPLGGGHGTSTPGQGGTH